MKALDQIRLYELFMERTGWDYKRLFREAEALSNMRTDESPFHTMVTLPLPLARFLMALAIDDLSGAAILTGELTLDDVR